MYIFDISKCLFLSSVLPDLNVHILYSLPPSLSLFSLSLPPAPTPSDIRRIGVILIGHQRRIISSIQTLRLHMMHMQEKGFHVWKYYKHRCFVPQHFYNERYPLHCPLFWFSKHHFTNCISCSDYGAHTFCLCFQPEF